MAANWPTHRNKRRAQASFQLREKKRRAQLRRLGKNGKRGGEVNG